MGSTKLPLLGRDGKAITLPIAVGTGTGASATVVHRATEGALDEVYIWASNYSGGDVDLTLSVGDSSFTANKTIVSTLTSQNGLVLVYPGIPHNNQTTIYAKAPSATAINLFGFVVRYFAIDRQDKDYGFGRSQI